MRPHRSTQVGLGRGLCRGEPRRPRVAAGPPRLADGRLTRGRRRLGGRRRVAAGFDINCQRDGRRSDGGRRPAALLRGRPAAVLGAGRDLLQLLLRGRPSRRARRGPRLRPAPRRLASLGPHHGHVLRPSFTKVPRRSDTTERRLPALRRRDGRPDRRR